MFWYGNFKHGGNDPSDGKVRLALHSNQGANAELRDDQVHYADQPEWCKLK